MVHQAAVMDVDIVVLSRQAKASTIYRKGQLKGNAHLKHAPQVFIVLSS